MDKVFKIQPRQHQCMKDSIGIFLNNFNYINLIKTQKQSQAFSFKNHNTRDTIWEQVLMVPSTSCNHVFVAVIVVDDLKWHVEIPFRIKRTSFRDILVEGLYCLTQGIKI